MPAEQGFVRYCDRARNLLERSVRRRQGPWCHNRDIRPDEAEQGKIEQMAGVKLAILPSSTTRGLTDLAQGRADIAMLAEPLESAAASVNQKQPGTVVIDEHGQPARRQCLCSIHRPPEQSDASARQGPTRRAVQRRGQELVRAGRAEPAGAAHRRADQLAPPADRRALAISYSPDLRVVQNTNQTAVIVAQAPGALSYISTAHDVPNAASSRSSTATSGCRWRSIWRSARMRRREVRAVVEAAAAVAKQ